jgi:hypothetical protein
MSKEMILSRQDVEFLLFDWLKVDELSQRPRFAGQERFEYTSVLDVYESLATDLLPRIIRKMTLMSPCLMESVSPLTQRLVSH